MVISNYVRFYDIEETYFIYNVMTKCILQIDKDLYIYLKKCSDENKDVSQNWPDEIYFELCNRGFIVHDLKESINQCVGKILYNRTRNDFKHITIAPTTDCCFACYYCFEKNRKAVYMDDSVIENIINYILSDSKLQKLHITWFGGEPLMARDSILKFSNKLNNYYLGHYTSDIITNGFFLNHESIEILKASNITEIQISLDGDKERHNKIKQTFVDPDAYETTLHNIESLLSEYPAIRVNLRVNFTKNEKELFVNAYNQLTKRFQNYVNVTISPGYVVNKRDRNSCNGNSCVCFNFEDRHKCSIDLWEDNNIPSGRILYNDYTTECAVWNPNSIVIDPKGKIYRCWEHLGDEKYLIGEISKTGSAVFKENDFFDALLTFSDPLKIDVCRNCCFLPICYSGCPVERYYTTNKKDCIIDTKVFDNLIKNHIKYLISIGRIK